MEYASFVAIWEVESEVYNQNLISLESILHNIIIITTIIICWLEIDIMVCVQKFMELLRSFLISKWCYA